LNGLHQARVRTRIGGCSDQTFVAHGGVDGGATTADEAACGAGKSLGKFSSTKNRATTQP